MNLPEDVPLLLFIGRFIPAKGLLDVIRACGLLRDRGQQFLLLAIGDGPVRADAENEVARLNLRTTFAFWATFPKKRQRVFMLTATCFSSPLITTKVFRW